MHLSNAELTGLFSLGSALVGGMAVAVPTSIFSKRTNETQLLAARLVAREEMNRRVHVLLQTWIRKCDERASWMGKVAVTGEESDPPMMPLVEDEVVAEADLIMKDPNFQKLHDSVIESLNYVGIAFDNVRSAMQNKRQHIEMAGDATSKQEFDRLLANYRGKSSEYTEELRKSFEALPPVPKWRKRRAGG